MPATEARTPGSLGPYENEKVYTLKVARLVEGNSYRANGYRVVMTRDSDVSL